MKTTMRVPIGQYAYVELEGKKSDLGEMEGIYNKYADKPLTKNNGSFVKIKTFMDETILYNDADHIYTDEDHNPLLSGSSFASRYVKAFPRDMMAAKTAKKNDIDVEVVKAMWESSGEVSRNFGTDMHAALERHFTYKDTPGYKTPNHPIIKEIVESFPLFDTTLKTIPEVVISNVKRKMVGTADLMVIVDAKKKILDLYDYKFSYDISKSLEQYQIQMNYYARMFEFHGWTVRNRVIANYTTEWQMIDVDKIDLTQLKEPGDKNVMKI